MYVCFLKKKKNPSFQTIPPFLKKKNKEEIARKKEKEEENKSRKVWKKNTKT